MEFLKALEKAKQYGIGKEEFMPIWQLELQDRKEAVHEDSSGQNCNDSFGRDESLLSKNFDKLSKEMADVKMELKMQFQCLHKQINEEYEAVWANLQKCHKSMEENFNCCFEMLSKHVTNSMESQTSGLKMFLMRELEVVKQEISRKLEGFSSSLRSVQPVSLSVDSEGELANPHGTFFDQHQHECNQLQPNQHEEQQESLAEQQPLHQQQQPLHQQQQQKKKHRSKGSKQSKDKNSCDAKESKEAMNSSSPPVFLSSEIATGPYATAISNQMKSRASSLDHSQFSSLCSSEDISNDGRQFYPFLPPGIAMQKVFTVSSCNLLRSSGKSICSPFFQLASKICKVRVQIRFDPSDILRIRFLVSRGENASGHEWPRVLSSYGDVYNSASKLYSALWNLKSTVCEFPQNDEEIAFEVLICLETARDSYSRVTYRILEEKSYITDSVMKIGFYFEASHNLTW